ncbi:HET-domain-containing protein [Hyaloscypha bicolor E]|uniref:HET-domain-containing protein n=1 Tax=Hyaloscypha bicolor E TaxID=1095630 RepID=A0A2J6TWY1_9HELO|nr:HET-domain-containing protein [Hyaloscypha bicolor E]PMD67515.1 HET-domain-containing protein [Hyaloscypha bicolor E]
MDQTSNSFEYKPLDEVAQEIRLVRLLPGSGQERICCSLDHAFLAHAASSYEALSYFWGDPKATLPISLDVTTFQVTENLESALRHLRLEDRDRTLWIDAICIDQANPKERARQVQVMGKIYQRARRVLVWLGDEIQDTGLAFELMIKRADGESLAEALVPSVQKRGEAMLQHWLLLDRKGSISRRTRSASVKSRVLGGRITKLNRILRDPRPNIALEPRVVHVLEQQAQLMQAFDPPTRKVIEALPLMGEDEEECGFRGEDEVDAERAIERETSQGPEEEDWTEEIEPESLEESRNDRAIEAFGDLFNRPWWKRIWVVQELARSRQATFICGSHSASWETMRANVVPQEDDLTWGYHPCVADMLSVWGPYSTQERRCVGLLDYLSTFRYCGATDPRDKVFALLGLAIDIDGSDLDANYSLELEDLYKRVVRVMISQHRNLDVLGHVLGMGLLDGSDRKVTFPSWTPDWRMKVTATPFQEILTMNGEANFYSASGTSTPNFSFSPDFQILTLEGFVFGTLQHLEEVLEDLGSLFGNDFNEANQHLTVIQRWEERALEEPVTLCPYLGKTGRLDAFWRTLTADAFLGQRKAPDEIFKQFEVWSGRTDLASVIDPEDLPTQYINYATPFVRSLDEASSGRRFLVSDGGYMGLAPQSAEEADLICVLLGGQTPFVLRPREDLYELIGPCYVHGIMDGEAMEQSRLRNFELEDFRLQ